MWEYIETDKYVRRLRQYNKKKNRPSLIAMTDNLDTYLSRIFNGDLPQNIHFGFVHHEPAGVVAIDQKGHAPNLRQTRLYLYVHVSDSIIHLITIGDKNTQSADIRFATEYVRSLDDEDKS